MTGHATVRFLLPALALLVGIVVGAGCGGEDETTVTETVAPTQSTETNPEPSTTTATAPIRDDIGEFFYSPSRNIGCLIHAGEAQCAANEYSYEPPPKPASCELDWGRSVGVSASGRGEFTCIGGLLAPPDSPTLEYGHSTGKGAITCESSEAGIRCETQSGHGFTLARERAEVY